MTAIPLFVAVCLVAAFLWWRAHRRKDDVIQRMTVLAELQKRPPAEPVQAAPLEGGGQVSVIPSMSHTRGGEAARAGKR